MPWQQVCAAALIVFGAGVAPAVAAGPITVGSLTLNACTNGGFAGYCGSLPRPLDPTAVVPGTVNIGFEFYPATDTSTPPTGTILAEEGGPGSASTGSRAGYLTLFGPLRNHRNIVIIDKRGTGLSQPVDCKAVRKPFDMTTQVAAECGRELGASADLYGTDLAADDIAAVLIALQTQPVDYYGDSYATFFGQVLAYRHPTVLRSMVLDSAFPVLGETPWFPTEWTAARNAYELVCERSHSCARLGGSSLARIDRLLESLRATPVSGAAPAGGSSTAATTANAGELYLTMSYAGHWQTAYRDLDAAARDYLGTGDSLPLLRLVAETNNSTGFGLGPYVESFSTGLFVAVTCSDFPLLWKPRAGYAARQSEYNASVAGEEATNPNLFSPFTISEVLAQPNTLIMPWMCLGWPRPSPAHPQGRPVPPNAQFPNIPTLVLSGELDTLTSPAEGALTAALLPGARQLLVPNLTHETAISDLGIHTIPGGGDMAHCVAPIVLAFVQTLEVSDIACTNHIRPIRLVPKFAQWSKDVDPATAGEGNQAPTALLRIASAAAETVGDVIARYYVAFGDENLGLRGGSFHFQPTQDGTYFKLNNVRWTQDLAVSGSITWNQMSGVITAHVAVTQDKGPAGSLDIVWNDKETEAQAKITGVVAGSALIASRVAP